MAQQSSVPAGRKFNAAGGSTPGLPPGMIPTSALGMAASGLLSHNDGFGAGPNPAPNPGQNPAAAPKKPDALGCAAAARTGAPRSGGGGGPPRSGSIGGCDSGSASAQIEAIRRRLFAETSDFVSAGATLLSHAVSMPQSVLPMPRPSAAASALSLPQSAAVSASSDPVGAHSSVLGWGAQASATGQLQAATTGAPLLLGNGMPQLPASKQQQQPQQQRRRAPYAPGGTMQQLLAGELMQPPPPQHLQQAGGATTFSGVAPSAAGGRQQGQHIQQQQGQQRPNQGQQPHQQQQSGQQGVRLLAFKMSRCC